MSESENARPISVSIKVGASILTLQGTTPAAVKKLVADVTGLENAKDKTLLELVIEADTHGTGVWTAASMVGFQPTGGAEERARTERSPSLPPAGTTTDQFRQSIVDKAAEAAQPEDYTDDIFALIANATSQQSVLDIRDANKDNWTEAHRVAAAARWNELGEK